MFGLIAHALIFNEAGELLTIKRSMIKRGKVNYQAGKWDIPGGTVNPKELPQDAAVREVREETALIVMNLRIVHECSKFDSEKNKVFTTLIYACDLEGTSKIVLDPQEHTDYRWVSPREVLNHKAEYVDYMEELINCLEERS